MTGTLSLLAAAAAAFLASHLVLSRHAPRVLLVARLGETGFLLLYSVLALASFGWLVAAYAAAPASAVYTPAPWTRAIPLLVMPFSTYLLVCGVTMRNPTAVYPGLARSGAGLPRGVVRITRHPVMWGIALWAGSHLTANGTAADLLLFGSLLVLALAGAAHIDARARRAGGVAWRALEAGTSFLPLQAVLDGRTRLEWRDLGGWRIAAAVVLYGALVAAHPWLAGVALLPR